MFIHLTRTLGIFMKHILIYSLFLIVTLLPNASRAEEFSSWLDDVRSEAAAKGISQATISAAFADISPNERVIELDRKQPESTKTFEQYMELVLNDTRKNKAVALYKQHEATLSRISETYGVQPEYIVALWGIESNFGERMGDFSVIRSLATLAYDGRRSEYFKKELFNALKIIDEGHISAEDMLGSWAGAMGQCQFMPTSFLSYAQDGNGDGKKDIWGTTEDVFASVANYLSSVGWNGDIAWGTPVVGASAADTTSYKSKNSLRSLDQQGIRPATQLSWQAPVALLSGNHDNQGPFFAVTENYDNILKWNRSRYFAIAVGTLADHIKTEAAK